MSSDVLGALQVGFSGRIVRIEKLRVVNNCRILFISNIGCSRKNLKASDIFLMQIKITIFSQKAKFILLWKKGGVGASTANTLFTHLSFCENGIATLLQKKSEFVWIALALHAHSDFSYPTDWIYRTLLMIFMQLER